MNQKIDVTNPAAVIAFAKGDVDNAIVASTPGGIEAQEAAGQQELCNNTLLPKEMGDGAKEKLEEMGVSLKDSEDELFYEAILPDGWKKQATDHSMHNDLLDADGNKIANIFYKAAFYDRRASLTLTYQGEQE